MLAVLVNHRDDGANQKYTKLRGEAVIMSEENGPTTEHWIPDAQMDDTQPERFTVGDFEDTGHVTESTEDTKNVT
jgi:hypothetical protein